MTTSRGTPHHGVRFELRRLATDEDGGATYREDIFFPDQTLRQTIRLHPDSDPEVLESSALPADPPSAGADSQPTPAGALPEWAARYRHKQWKMLAREARRSGVWPRKLRRWQGAPGDPL